MPIEGQRYHREVLKRAKVLASAEGFSCWLEVSTAGHPKLIIHGNGQTRMATVSSSPRCADASLKKAVCEIRRIIRQMSLTKGGIAGIGS